jgi:4-hydroxybenzoate polyprenyltransferase
VNKKVILNYILIARPSHWFKNILILPGLVIAVMLSEFSWSQVLLNLLIGFASTCLIASANYVINEWLDTETDKFHPEKKARPFVKHNMKISVIIVEYLLLAGVGIFLASLISPYFLSVACLLLFMGILYNVKPIRTKDKVYLDVLSESVNNPIRLMLGWFIVEGSLLPPASFILAYWMGGAFLMNTKRYAEYRFINDPKIASLYRKSFKYYSEEKLLLLSFFYSMCSAFFLGIFLIKHRIEFFCCLPFIAILFTWYLHLSLKPNSTVQKPEKLYRETAFMAYVLFIIMLLVALLFIDIPNLHFLLENTFIKK